MSATVFVEISFINYMLATRESRFVKRNYKISRIRFYIESRWLERVFKCCKPFKTRKNYNEVFLSMWAIYEYLDNSFIGQYFKAGCDVIAVTMTTLKVHKKNPQISVFAKYPKN